MKDDGDGDGDSAGDGELTLLKTGYRECFFVFHLLWSQIPKQLSARPQESAVFITQT